MHLKHNETVQIDGAAKDLIFSPSAILWRRARLLCSMTYFATSPQSLFSRLHKCPTLRKLGQRQFNLLLLIQLLQNIVSFLRILRLKILNLKIMIFLRQVRLRRKTFRSLAL